MKEAEVSCVVTWVMWSQPHVKLALQHDFTVAQSFHEMRPCVVRTESFLLLESGSTFSYRALYSFSRVHVGGN